LKFEVLTVTNHVLLGCGMVGGKW